MLVNALSLFALLPSLLIAVLILGGIASHFARIGATTLGRSLGPHALQAWAGVRTWLSALPRIPPLAVAPSPRLSHV